MNPRLNTTTHLLRGSFEEYYKKYYPIALKYLCNKVQNTQTAEDIATDAFVVCYEKFAEFDPSKASFQTWLFVIVNNKLKNYYRDNKEFAELEEDICEESDFADELAEASHMSYLRKRLAEALKELPETQRQIVIYKYFYNKKSNEIAELVGTTPGNVRVQLKRAIDKLREIFDINNIRWN